LKLQKQVIAFGSQVSHALHTACHFLKAPCYFAIKSRHKTKEGIPGYSMLSWHMTLLAMAPYDDWRMAMQHIEAHVYPKQQQKQQADGQMHISLLSDMHITRNSKVFYSFCLLFFLILILIMCAGAIHSNSS